MKRYFVFGMICLVLFGCSIQWGGRKLEQANLSSVASQMQLCKDCHELEYNSWQKTRHAAMDKKSLNGEKKIKCEICHANIDNHIKDPQQEFPSSLRKLSKLDQNILCGKCHYDIKVVGKEAINPHDRHGLFLSVGFSEQKKIISCLDCHQGHTQKNKMLKTNPAHLCFTCHKEAIVTMGAFQPINYLTFGKTCFACHPVHGGSAIKQSARMLTGAAVACLVCHPTGDTKKTIFN